MPKFKAFLSVCLFILVSLPAQAKIIHVPADSSTIQKGIDGAVNGDTVLVDRGTYHEKINFLGKNILLTSNYLFDKDTNTVNYTIISGDSAGTVVTFNSLENSSAVLYGFTITKGFGGSTLGAGGVLCERTSPTISHNRIINNVGSIGGGIILYFSSARIINNIIARNKADGGAGIAALEGGGEVLGNLIMQNEASRGGGIYIFFYETMTLRNNTIVANKAQSVGGAIMSYEDFDMGNTYLWARDNIIAFNDAPVAGAVYRGDFCDLQFNNNLFWLNGPQPYSYHFSPNSSNIQTEDPGFINPDSGNYRLYQCSPCVDRGDTSAPNLLTNDLDGNPRIVKYCDSLRVDLGAYEKQADSLTLRGYIDRNCRISVSDVVMLVSYLFKGGKSPCRLLAADVNCDGKVSVADVVYLINYLFKGGPPPCEPQ